MCDLCDVCVRTISRRCKLPRSFNGGARCHEACPPLAHSRVGPCHSRVSVHVVEQATSNHFASAKQGKPVSDKLHATCRFCAMCVCVFVCAVVVAVVVACWCCCCCGGGGGGGGGGGWWWLVVVVAVVRRGRIDMVPLGSADEPLYKYDTDKRKWVMTVFPSLFPAGRRDVELLEQWLDENVHEDFRPLQELEALSARASAREARVNTPTAGGGGGGNTSTSRPATSLTARHEEMMKISKETQAQAGLTVEVLKKVRGVCGVGCVCLSWRMSCGMSCGVWRCCRGSQCSGARRLKLCTPSRSMRLCGKCPRTALSEHTCWREYGSTTWPCFTSWCPYVNVNVLVLFRVLEAGCTRVCAALALTICMCVCVCVCVRVCVCVCVCVCPCRLSNPCVPHCFAPKPCCARHEMTSRAGSGATQSSRRPTRNWKTECRPRS